MKFVFLALLVFGSVASANDSIEGAIGETMGQPIEHTLSNLEGEVYRGLTRFFRKPEICRGVIVHGVDGTFTFTLRAQDVEGERVVIYRHDVETARLVGSAQARTIVEAGEFRLEVRMKDDHQIVKIIGVDDTGVAAKMACVF